MICSRPAVLRRLRSVCACLRPAECCPRPSESRARRDPPARFVGVAPVALSTGVFAAVRHHPRASLLPAVFASTAVKLDGRPRAVRPGVVRGVGREGCGDAQRARAGDASRGSRRLCPSARFAERGPLGAEAGDALSDRTGRGASGRHMFAACVLLARGARREPLPEALHAMHAFCSTLLRAGFLHLFVRYFSTQPYPTTVSPLSCGRAQTRSSRTLSPQRAPYWRACTRRPAARCRRAYTRRLSSSSTASRPSSSATLFCLRRTGRVTTF